MIYVSTAYSSCNRYDIEEILYPLSHSPQKIIDICESMNDDMLATITPELIDGYRNTYAYTKALTEAMVAQEFGSLPVAIIRPSIVTASWKEPLPGWVDTKTGLTGVILAVGKGVYRHAFLKPNYRSDIIPVDTVVNLMITLVWFTAIHHPTDIPIYNCTSGESNPITFGQIIEELSSPNSGHIRYPSREIYRYPSINYTESQLLYKLFILFDHYLPAYLFDALMFVLGRKRIMVKICKSIHRSLDVVGWFMIHEFQFSNRNLQMLNKMLGEYDRKVF